MKLLALVVFSLLTVTAKAESVCDFYVDKANELGCDDSNYLIRFGYRYCRKFEKKDLEFSAQARPVLSRLRLCLIDAIESAHPTCDTTAKIAYESHVNCYLDNGFCTLKNSDKIKILWTVRSELLNPKFRRVANEILLRCREK